MIKTLKTLAAAVWFAVSILFVTSEPVAAAEPAPLTVVELFTS
ncbi:MAG TPA: hypothetical protein QGH84_03560 [Rhodospirillales bacterium]|nr:hypothetical protein [Rhodospirillales bacterium]